MTGMCVLCRHDDVQSENSDSVSDSGVLVPVLQWLHPSEAMAVVSLH